jgi:hypothetical protein
MEASKRGVAEPGQSYVPGKLCTPALQQMHIHMRRIDPCADGALDSVGVAPGSAWRRCHPDPVPGAGVRAAPRLLAAYHEPCGHAVGSVGVGHVSRTVRLDRGADRGGRALRTRRVCVAGWSMAGYGLTRGRSDPSESASCRGTSRSWIGPAMRSTWRWKMRRTRRARGCEWSPNRWRRRDNEPCSRCASAAMLTGGRPIHATCRSNSRLPCSSQPKRLSFFILLDGRTPLFARGTATAKAVGAQCAFTRDV